MQKDLSSFNVTVKNDVCMALLKFSQFVNTPS